MVPAKGALRWQDSPIQTERQGGAGWALVGDRGERREKARKGRVRRQEAAPTEDCDGEGVVMWGTVDLAATLTH